MKPVQSCDSARELIDADDVQCNRRRAQLPQKRLHRGTPSLDGLDEVRVALLGEQRIAGDAHAEALAAVQDGGGEQDPVAAVNPVEGAPQGHVGVHVKPEVLLVTGGQRGAVANWDHVDGHQGIGLSVGGAQGAGRHETASGRNGAGGGVQCKGQGVTAQSGRIEHNLSI